MRCLAFWNCLHSVQLCLLRGPCLSLQAAGLPGTLMHGSGALWGPGCCWWRWFRFLLSSEVMIIGKINHHKKNTNQYVGTWCMTKLLYTWLSSPPAACVALPFPCLLRCHSCFWRHCRRASPSIGWLIASRVTCFPVPCSGGLLGLGRRRLSAARRPAGALSACVLLLGLVMLALCCCSVSIST